MTLGWTPALADEGDDQPLPVQNPLHETRARVARRKSRCNRRKSLGLMGSLHRLRPAAPRLPRPRVRPALPHRAESPRPGQPAHQRSGISGGRIRPDLLPPAAGQAAELLPSRRRLIGVTYPNPDSNHRAIATPSDTCGVQDAARATPLHLFVYGRQLLGRVSCSPNRFNSPSGTKLAIGSVLEPDPAGRGRWRRPATSCPALRRSRHGESWCSFAYAAGESAENQAPPGNPNPRAASTWCSAE